MKGLTRIFSILTLLATAGAWAAEVSPEQAMKAAQNWVARGPSRLDSVFASAKANTVQTIEDAYGAAMCHIVALADGGFVATSADTRLEPIVAFSATDELAEYEGSPLQALLEGDARFRMESLPPQADPSSTQNALYAEPPNEHEAQWAELLSDEPSASRANSLESVSDVRVSPMLQTKWDQSTWGNYPNTPNTFNYYTPNNYVCGCVATAGAQIMKYWEMPTGTQAQFTNHTCAVSGTTTTRTSIAGAYNWSSMPLSHSSTSSPTETQRRAIGMLTYNVGVAVGMKWGPTSTGGSSADTGNLTTVLKSRFGYASGQFVWYYLGLSETSSYTANFNNALYASLDAGMPASLSIGGSAGGHSIVADGYGYSSSTRYVHLNMGWSGEYDVWYNIPNEELTNYKFTTIKGIGFNLHPTESGDVISGRVLNASGSAVSGATVQLKNSSGTVVGIATSNNRGIYSFRVSATGIYDVSATYGSQVASAKKVTISALSSSGDFTGGSTGAKSGNSWGNDLTLAASGSFTITLNKNDGTSTSTTRSTSTGSLTLPTASSLGWSRTGYTFMGWSTYSSATSATYNGGDTVSVSSSTMLYAVWKPSSTTWTVYLYKNDGNGIYTYRSTSTGSLTLPTASALGWTRTGYTFKGWSESSTATTATYSDGATITVSSTRFLYAVWSATSLASALDCASLTFSTTGDADWYSQGSYYYTGGSAARSGAIGNDQESILATTISGAGTLSFNWWVSCETSSSTNWDYLVVSVDGTERKRIAGTPSSWTGVSLSITGAGTHTVTWVYHKDGSFSNGLDAGFVDNVRWTPAATTCTLTFNKNDGTSTYTTRSATAGSFTLPTISALGWTRTGYTFKGWSATANSTTVNYGDGATLTLSTSRSLYAVWAAASLASTLDCPSLTFSTSGDASWYSQTLRYHTGGSSARSGAIGHNQESHLTATVSGAGTLSFNWWVSCETGIYTNWDYLVVSVDGTERKRLAGTPSSWTGVSLAITGAGSHTVKWTYHKDGNISKGLDAGFVDNVKWTPSSTTYTLTLKKNDGTSAYTTRSATAGSFTLPTISALGWTRTGYTFKGWSTSASATTATYNDGATITVSASRTLYAVWAAASLASTLDCPSLTFSTSGDASWYSQTLRYHTGGSSARSGAIGHNQESHLTATVSGAGTLSFNWWVSCETGIYTNWDYLVVSVDGTEKRRLAGTPSSWTGVSLAITGTGTHTVKWTYHKDGNISKGLDAGFVDNVRWTPAVTTYTIRYHKNDGSGEYKDKPYNRDVRILLESPKTLGIWKDGCQTFDGWALTATGDVKYENRYAAKNFTGAGKVLNLYAVWPAQTYTIRYHKNDGSGVYKDKPYNRDVRILLESPKTLGIWKDGCKDFNGWALTATGDVKYENRYAGKNFTGAGKVLNLYAKWPNSSSTTTYQFTSAGGSGTWTVTYTGAISISGWPTPNVSWISVTGIKSSSSGGNVTIVVSYTVAANTSATARSGTITGTFGGIICARSVTQAGATNALAANRVAAEAYDSASRYTGSLYLAGTLYGVIGVEVAEGGDDATVRIATVGGETSGPYDCTVGADGAVTGVIPGYGTLDAIADDTDDTLTGTLGDFDIE